MKEEKKNHKWNLNKMSNNDQIKHTQKKENCNHNNCDLIVAFRTRF